MVSRRHRLARRRASLGYTQEQLAERLGVDRTTVVRWERGDTSPQPGQRPGLAEALAVSLADLDDLLTNGAARSPTRPGAATVTPDSGVVGDGMNRRSFTAATVFAMLGFPRPVRELLAAAEPPRRFGAEHLRLLALAIERIEQADAAAGGNALYEAAAELHSRLAAWTHECSYPGRVGVELQAAVGDLGAWLGWLALDADRIAPSRRHLHETIVRARVAGDPALEVRAMTYLSLLTRRERPREALQVAEAAQRIAAPWATPRLAALLHLRAAHAHAELREPRPYQRALAKARAQFDRGTCEDDPAYIRFVTAAELTGVVGMSQLAMDRPDRAAAAFREIVDNPDPVYRRNAAYYGVRLAEATARQGDVAGACEIGLAAIPQVAALDSGRTVRHLAELRAAVAPHAASVPRTREFADAYDERFPR